MNEQWIEQMQQKMAGYKRPAPEVSWDELDRALAVGKSHKTRQLWLRRMVAAAVVLLIAGVGYWGLLHHETEQVVEKHVAENHGEGLSGSCIQPSQDTIPVIYARSIHKSNSNKLISESETIIPVSETDNDTVKTAITEEKEQAHDVEKDTTPIEPKHPIAYPTDFYQQKHKNNRLMAKVYMSSTITGSQKNAPIYATNAETYHDVHHLQPIRFGLSLRYRLNDHWSVESGLSYTRLSSDISTTTNGKTTITEQHLNYIGLPLNISYDLWKSNHFGLYVTTGGTIEKSLDTSPWLFSLNGTVGAEYKLTDIISLYAEPGLGYYFKDGSSTPTIYQDHPLNFNLSLGLRFNLKKLKD